MNEELKTLKFELDKKMSELNQIQLDIFIYHPEINQLLNEITDLREKIQELEALEDNK